MFSTKQMTFGLRQKDGDQRNSSKGRNGDRKGGGQIGQRNLKEVLGAKAKAEEVWNPVGLGLGILF